MPGVIKQMGEDTGSLVVTPDGRGSSTWYVGKGQVDYPEVWDDVHKLVNIDRNREYIAGHSMGGWASWLLPILYPDRFAAAFPASGPPTQGLWAGCDDDACFQSANDGRPRDEWTTPLLENLRWVPYVNYQGADDELVPVTGVTMQMKQMQDLGFRYRYYVFPHEEHYGPPIFDQWAEGVKYEHQFMRNPNPPAVTLHPQHADGARGRGGQRRQGAAELRLRQRVLGERARAGRRGEGHRARGRALARDPRARPRRAARRGAAGVGRPDRSRRRGSGSCGSTHAGSEPAARNAFTAKLTGAKAVRAGPEADADPDARPDRGDVTTEKPLRLELSGRWAKRVTATLDGAPVPSSACRTTSSRSRSRPGSTRSRSSCR